MEVLPLILLGFRATFKVETNTYPPKLVYGCTLRLSGEFLKSSSSEKLVSESDFVNDLRSKMQNLKAKPTSCHAESTTFIDNCLNTTRVVFIRTDAVRKPLQLSYKGPFTVIERFEKYFKINMNGKHVNVSIDRLKAAFSNEGGPQNRTPTTTKEMSTTPITTKEKPASYTTSIGRRV